MTHRTGSRQDQILQLLLDARSGMSIDELASRLEISRNAVKQHLVVLEKDLLIKKDALNSTGGRPSQNYVLTENGINHFPKQYSWFCNLMLAEIKEEKGEEAFKQFMWRLGAKLAQSLLPQFNNKPTDEKLRLLIATMQQLGYRSSQEQTGLSPQIKATNCVYHDLAQQYPELCEFDRALISILLDKPVEQTECMAQKGCACKFLIKNQE